MPKPLTSDVPQSKVTPDPKLEKRTRRKYSADYKLKIIEKANACQHGELGKLLREEGLYSNQLKQWRDEYAANGIAGLSKSAPGPQAKYSPEQREIQKLKKENTRLVRELEISNGCIDLQKKALVMLDLMNKEKEQ